MTTRRKVALTLLVWVIAAGLCALPSVWPWYRHILPVIQYELGIVTGSTLTLTTCRMLRRRR